MAEALTVTSEASVDRWSWTRSVHAVAFTKRFMIPVSQRWLLGSILVAAAVAPMAGRIDSYVLDVLLGATINITLAVSLNLINGFTGQFSLGHAGFMAVGAYASALLTVVYGKPFGSLLGHQPFLMLPVALIAGGMAAAVSGLLVGAPSLRLRGDYLAIVTLGFGEIIKVILQNVPLLGGALGLNGIPTPINRGWAEPVLFFNLATACITVYVVWALVDSTFGRGFIAVADDEVATEAMGINTTRYKIQAFVVGAFFAGVAGGLYAHLKGSLSPTGFDFNRSIEIVVMVILGGMGRHVGVIAAAILLTVVQEPLRKLGDWRMILYALLLIGLMLTRPQGLFTWPLWRRTAPAK